MDLRYRIALGIVLIGIACGVGHGTPSQAEAKLTTQPPPKSRPKRTAKASPTPPDSQSAIKSRQPAGVDTIIVILPSTLRLDKYQIKNLSETAGNYAAMINACLANREPYQTGKEVARFCNSIYGARVVALRNQLRNAGAIIGALEIAMIAIERGPTERELRHAADVLVLISEELGKRGNDETAPPATR